MPEAKTKVKIVQAMIVPSMDKARTGRLDQIVIYDAGNGQKGMVTVPAEGLTDAVIIKAIGDRLKQQSSLVGRELDV